MLIVNLLACLPDVTRYKQFPSSAILICIYTGKMFLVYFQLIHNKIKLKRASISVAHFPYKSGSYLPCS